MTRHAPSRPGARGQLSFDYMVGMGVFLLAVGFAIGFLPGMFEPFTADSGVNMIVADRSAAHLAGTLLAGDRTRQSVLNETCTVEFFDADGAVADCAFDADADDLHGALGVDSIVRLNVTVEHDGSVMTLDGQALAAGPPPGNKADLTVSRRIVLLDGTERRLFVRAW